MTSDNIATKQCLDYGFIHVLKDWNLEEMEVPLKYFKLTSPGEKRVPSEYIRGFPSRILEFLQTMDWEANEGNEWDLHRDAGDDEGISCGGIEVDQQPKSLDTGMLPYITRTGLYYRPPPRYNNEERHWQRLGGRVFVGPNGEWCIVELISEGTQMLNGFEVKCQSSSDDCHRDIREGHYKLDLNMTPPKWTWCVRNFVGLKKYHRRNNKKICRKRCVIVDIDMDEDAECQSKFIAIDEKGHYAPVEKIQGSRDRVARRIRYALKPYTPCMWNSNVRRLPGFKEWRIWEFEGGWYQPFRGVKQSFDIIKAPASFTSQRFDENNLENRPRRLQPTRAVKRKLK